jgi:hypothetical protein
MPLYKLLANRGLTAIENRLLGTSLSEAHTGYRAYSRRLLLEIPFLRNSIDFVFDSEVLFQAVHFGLRIEEIAARSVYTNDSSSITLRPATVYALKTLWGAVRFRLHRARIWRSRKFMP